MARGAPCQQDFTPNPDVKSAEHAREFGCDGASSIEEQIEDLMSTSGSWLPAFMRVRSDPTL